MNDWIVEESDRRFITIHKKFTSDEESISLLIPNDKSLVDYTHRINDIIGSIAVLEEKDVKDIVKEIENVEK